MTFQADQRTGRISFFPSISRLYDWIWQLHTELKHVTSEKVGSKISSDADLPLCLRRSMQYLVIHLRIKKCSFLALSPVSWTNSYCQILPTSVNSYRPTFKRGRKPKFSLGKLKSVNCCLFEPHVAMWLNLPTAGQHLSCLLRSIHR